MLEKVNIKSVVNAVEKLYVYDKVGRLNGHILSVVNVENRTLDFHIHKDSDELLSNLGNSSCNSWSKRVDHD